MVSQPCFRTITAFTHLTERRSSAESGSANNCAANYRFTNKSAVARFFFKVSNQYNLPRTFQSASSQQFDLEILDQTGRVVAAWSDAKFFIQSLTTFTLEAGGSVTFTADMPLKDREGQQLNGTYRVRAFLTTSGPQPRVEAASQIAVALAP